MAGVSPTDPNALASTLSVMSTHDASTPIAELGRRSKAASRALATASTAQKNDALHAAAERLVVSSDTLLSANAIDIARAEADGVSPTVTSDAAGLCLKSGNAAFLRGSSGAIDSNIAIETILRSAITEASLPADSVILVADTSREAAVEFMRQRETIDCLIPRGGPSLIASILENATVPYVIDGDGNCHVYVDVDADLEMAIKIIVNAKMQRPSVCNAAETLLVHRDVAGEFLPRAASALEGVELRADERALEFLPRATLATEEDWSTEFLDLTLAVGIVDDLDAAIDHIARNSSGHSEAIITRSLEAGDRFTHEVDAAAVLVNASTRFVDGEEFGFGAEIGISTQKLHARGPMGLRELTTAKFIVRGQGQTRG